MTDLIERSQVHATFTLERTFPVPVAKVWHAFADEDARDLWFGGGHAFDQQEKSHDFRVGGTSVDNGQWHDGPTSAFVATYTDIVDEQRIVYAYDMWVDGRHMSTSLTTIVFEETGTGTRLTFTEQGVHLDGLDDPAGRETGTAGLLDQLGSSLSGTDRP